jgi:hypothetical protein
MSNAQTSIQTQPDIAYAGLVSENQGARHLVSVIATGDFDAGQWVVQGASAADRTAQPPVSSAEVTGRLWGVAKYDPSKPISWPPRTDGFVGQYPIGATADVVRKGAVWVHVEEAVNAFDPVYVRYASGAGGTVLGASRKSADTATAAQASGCIYLTSAQAGGLALVEVNL